MPKFKVQFSTPEAPGEAVAVQELRIVAETSEAAVAAVQAEVGENFQFMSVAEVRRGRPRKNPVA